MTIPLTAVPSEHVTQRIVAIDRHLLRLRQGRDPYGHLLAIERLARAARAEWTALEATRTVPKGDSSAGPA